MNRLLFTDWLQKGDSSQIFNKMLMLIIVGTSAGYFIGGFQHGNKIEFPVVVTETDDLSNGVREKLMHIDEINGQVESNDNLKNKSNKPSNYQDYSIVFGSVNGTKYYNFGCKSGDRINDNNKIFFENITEAELHGYEAALNCDFSI